MELYKKQLSKKLKFLRSYRRLTQENVADKLGISTCAYANIERGDTNVNLSRLQQIAEVMGIDLSQLFSLDDKNVFNFTCDNNSQAQTQSPNPKIDNSFNSSPTEQTEYKHELEKAQLMIEQRDKENELLRQQVSDLREMNNLLKQSAKPKE